MLPSSPARWFPDPTRRYELRYRDGARWTEHVATQGRQLVDQPADHAGPDGQGPAWLPDPLGRHEHRFWDGQRWTDHVGTRGQQGTDPYVVTPVPHVPLAPAPPARAPSDPAVGHVRESSTSKKVQQQASRVRGTNAGPGGGTLLTEQVLVVNQKAKVFGSTLQYLVYDRDGRQLGAIREVPRGVVSKVVDWRRGRDDSNRLFRFEVVDSEDRTVLTLTRPESWFGFKSSIVVEGSDGRAVGQIIQETVGLLGGAATAGTMVAGLAAYSVLGGVAGALVGSSLGAAGQGIKKGHARFGLEAGGERLGSIHAESINAWNFAIRDSNGIEIGRITKTWAGWAKERFTKADNYVVVMHRPVEGPLRSLVVAAALALDVALKQDTPSHSRRLGKRTYR